MAGRSLGTALSVATMTGSELGLITVMYQAQKGFTGGLSALHIGLVAGVVTLFVGATGFIVVPLRRAGVMTIPEYYERRFGRRTRILGGILLAAGGILNMGLFLQVGAKFIVGVTGLDPRGGVLTLVMVSLMVLVLFYTVLGGMVSVVLTDYVQFVVLAAGLLGAVALALHQVGWTQIVTTLAEVKGPPGFDPTLPGAGFGPAYITWMAVLGMVSCAIWPTAVSRALSARDETVVRRQYALSSISFAIRFVLPSFLGVCALVVLVQGGASFFLDADGALPVGPGEARYFRLAEGDVVRQNLEAFPVFLGALLPAGMLGLVTAGMLAAFMSTHDSYLLCWASVLTRDVVGALRHRPLSEARQILFTRIGIVAIGLFVLFWGLFYEPRQDVWEYLGITGAIYFTGAISVLALGIYWERASSTGAVAALLAGFSAILGLGRVKEALGLGDLPAPWIGLATLVLSLLAMVVGSLLRPDPERRGAGDLP